MESIIKYGVVKKIVNKKKKLQISLESLSILALVVEDILDAACEQAIKDDSARLKPKHFKNLTIKLHD